jgi:DTW domain-containing protein YfiP
VFRVWRERVVLFSLLPFMSRLPMLSSEHSRYPAFTLKEAELENELLDVLFCAVTASDI